MATLHVSCAAEGTYVPHSAAMLHSVLAHAGGLDVRVHYLHSPGMDREQANAMKMMVSRLGGALEFHEVPPTRLAGLPIEERYTAAMWHRLLLPQLLPDVPRVLYLDIDTIAVDDLRPLWETDLRGHLLGAVSNVFQHNHVQRPKELGLPGAQVYFNSGVLLLDLDALRREGSAEAVRACAVQRGGELEWPDQDALNLVLGARRLALHPRYNAMNSLWSLPASRATYGLRARGQARRRPVVRHFEGPADNKPWHVRCKQPLRDRYFEHRRGTPWPEVEMIGR